jgi:hypothetical protein
MPNCSLILPTLQHLCSSESAAHRIVKDDEWLGVGVLRRFWLGLVAERRREAMRDAKGLSTVATT